MRTPTAPDLPAQIAAQRRWMRERGDSLAGYITFYTGHYPDEEVAAIYRADRETLDNLLGQIETGAGSAGRLAIRRGTYR